MIDLNDINDRAHAWASSRTGMRHEAVIKDLYKMILILEHRLNRIEPTQEQMDKYPTLKEAYEQFRIIQKLTGE